MLRQHLVESYTLNQHRRRTGTLHRARIHISSAPPSLIGDAPLIQPCWAGAELTDRYTIEAYTPVSTRRLRELLDDDTYAAFQAALMKHPRMPATSSRARAAFARFGWHPAGVQFALLLIYPKSERDDLSADERSALMRIVEKWA